MRASRAVRLSAVVLIAATCVGCGGGGGGSDSPQNRTPLVNAGPDQTVNEGAVVVLQGTASDSDGSLVSTIWSQISGPTVSIANPATLQTSFAAPIVSTDTTLVFQLTAQDDKGATNSDQVSVRVTPVNDPPIADAGPDGKMWEQDLGRLLGAGSDPDGKAVTFRWEQTDGPAVVLVAPASAATEFVAPKLSQETVLGFRLTVTDADGRSASDTTLVTVAPLSDISGSLLADRTLDGAYEVVADLSVAPGVTLTILPGSILRFQANVGLKVAGVLRADGTVNKPIFLTSIRPTRRAGPETWRGIECASCEASSSLSFVVIEHAVIGIDLAGTSEVSINNNVFRDLANGVTDAYGYHGVDITANTFVRMINGLPGLRVAGVGVIKSNRFEEVPEILPYGYYEGALTLESNSFNGATLVIKAPQRTSFTVSLVAANNWWGTTDEAKIASQIFDVFDDATLWEVPFKPYLTVAPQQVGSAVPADITLPGPS